jgi:hypothetical protein
MADERELVATVGAPTSPDGQTRVRLADSGRLVVQWERVPDDVPDVEQRPKEPERREETGELGVDPGPLFERSARFPWDQEFPTRPGVPDEAILEWDLREDDRSRTTLRVWLGDAERDPNMAPVLDALRDGPARPPGGAGFQ